MTIFYRGVWRRLGLAIVKRGIVIKASPYLEHERRPVHFPIGADAFGRRHHMDRTHVPQSRGAQRDFDGAVSSLANSIDEVAFDPVGPAISACTRARARGWR